ncbi:MAG TPA: C25 family cysteine peptidase [Candidatus Krumholzibacteria bacterium]|nr:C25 family cysteine peptidase [Candidatus Krumholzibacteria bacterium]
MRRALFPVLALLFFATPGWSAAPLILDLGSEPGMRVSRVSSVELRVEVDVGRLRFFDVETSEGTFTQMVIPGFHRSRDVGRPAVPVMNRLLAIPDGAAVTVDVVEAKTRKVPLDDIGVGHRLMPAQPSLSKSEDPTRRPLRFDEHAYATPVTLDDVDVARMVVQGRLRALDFGRLEVQPVAYDPVAGVLEIAESLQLRVRFDGGRSGTTADLLARTRSPFFDGIYDRLAASKGLHDSYPDVVRNEVTFVVVTPPEFEPVLEDFLAWKVERGFRVEVGLIGSPGVGSTTTSIQDYLHGLFHGATPERPAPSFVLFVGDVAQCPTWTIDGNATDRPYCTVDGDGIPDMYYGRFSATNTSELRAIVDKTMTYDTLSMADPSYLGDVVLIAGADASWAPTHGNGTINYGSDNYFDAAHGIAADVHLYPQSQYDAASIVSEVSQGRGFVNYTAHGSRTSWADPSFTQSDIAGLQNVDEYGLVIGNCCLTSTYDYGECFAESWLRAPDRGAIGYIGGSNSTYWDEDVYWSVGSTSSITADMPFESTGHGAYDGLFHDHGESEAQWYVTAHAVAFCGNLAVQESGSGLTSYYWDIYNLMGDPSLPVHVGVPATNPVVHADNLVANQTSVTVSAAAGSYVGVSQNGALLGAATVHAGATDVTIDYLQSLQAGVPAMVVVTGQNLVPYVAELPVAAPSEVTMVPAEFPAGIPTEVDLRVLRNDGVTPIADVEVRVSDPMEYVATAVTDSAGRASLTLEYPYGAALGVRGTHPVEGFLFDEGLTVTAAPLVEPDLTVGTELGFQDLFGMNLQSTIVARCGTPGATLVAYVPGLGRMESVDDTLVCTPTEGGEVRAFLLASGHEIHAETFPVLTQGSVRGTVQLEGEVDFSGVVLTASPGGTSTITAADGSYLLTELGAGEYVLTAEREGFSVGTVPLTVAEGEHLDGMDFQLSIVYETEACVEPALAIPDDFVRGVTSTLDVGSVGEITWVRAHLDLTHTYQGDLIVELVSPSGTTVVLHDRSGGSTDDIVGWYPDPLTPAEGLGAFVGEDMGGSWRLRVSDNAGLDTGTLNSWCVNLGYAGGTVTAAKTPRPLRLERNVPNPFNPTTTIGFSIPVETEVRLTVYDLRGRRVATIVDDVLPGGRHRSTWNGCDDRGRPLASGTYFYRLTAGERTLSRKMLLLK